MPMPLEFQHAGEDFEALLEDARAAADLVTRNQAYTMIDAVLRVFRRRLDLAQAIRFADVLPPLARALFVADWNPDEPVRPFGTRADLTEEVQSVRRHHNFAPDTAIAVVARALRRRLDEARLEAVLARLPAGAADYWRVIDGDG